MEATHTGTIGNSGTIFMLKRLATLIATLVHRSLMMDPRIQKALDDIAATRSLEQSAAAALALQASQIADMQKQIADIKAKSDVATSADLDALAAAADGLAETNAALQTAVPDNTHAMAPAAPAEGVTPGATGA